MIRIVSHTRTGTHYLARLLFDNLETGADDYEQLHYSHSRVPDDGGPYIHLHRPVYPVMLSIWKCRDHLGVSKRVPFADMLRTPWRDMPRAVECSAVFNGKRWDRVCPPHDFDGTLLDRWLRLTGKFDSTATLSVPYSLCVERPLCVVQRVAEVFSVRCRTVLRPVHGRVGWWSAEEETPTVTGADMALMEIFQRAACF